MEPTAQPMEAGIFGPLPGEAARVARPTGGTPRVQGADRQQTARQRAARERAERLARALAQIQELEKKRKTPAQPEPASSEPAKPEAAEDQEGDEGQDKKKEPKPLRVSTTDPEAHVMKMADGGFRPACNVQFAADTATQIVTGVDVGTVGSDQGQMLPMVEQHEDRYQQAPTEVLPPADEPTPS